jgi:hypothetical protein
MAKITVDILVPSEFIPPDDLDYTRWEQCLTFMLRGRFPQLLTKFIATRPHLSGLNLSPRDVEAQYRAHASNLRSDWWVTIRTDRISLGNKQQLDRFKTDLENAIRGWFLSKGYKGLRIHLDIE